MSYLMAAFLYCVLGLLVLVCAGAAIAAGAWEIGSGLLLISLLALYTARIMDQKDANTR